MKFNIPKRLPNVGDFNPLDVHCPPSDNITIASYAIVGESPSPIDATAMEPFKGPEGSQLSRIFNHAKVPRYKLYLTYACKSMLPPDKDGRPNYNKLWTPKGFRCAEWYTLQANLIEELKAFNGKLIFLLGNTPMKLLLDDPRMDSVEKYHGSVYRTEEFSHLATALPGKFICISYCPTMTLPRNKPVSFYIMLGEFQKFMALEQDESLYRKPEVVIKINPLFNDILIHYQQCMTKDEIAFDIESNPQFITCFSLAYKEDDKIISMSIPLMNNKGNMWTIDQEIEIWTGLAQILWNPNISILCQNGMFDIMFVLRTMNIISDSFSFDTMLAQHLVLTDLPKGLDFLTSAYTYFPYYKDERKQSHLKAIKNWPQYWEYNAKDAAYLFPIKAKLMEEITELNLQEHMDYMMALHKPLMEMEFNGILTDQVGMKKAKLSYERKYNALLHGLKKLVGFDLNINSSQQMCAYFYGLCMIKPYVQRAGKYKGNPTCGAMALSRIARKKTKGSVEAKIIMKLRKIGKLLSTYFIDNTDEDHKLRCSYKIAGTDTGRLSSEKTFFGTGANLQNQPYLFKKYLISEKDYILLEVDLQKAEAHVVAFLCQDELMIEAFEQGVDVHSLNASLIFDKTIEEVKNEVRIPGRLTMRDMGKKVKHASNYGMGPQTFSDNLAKEEIYVDFDECKKLLEANARRFPSLKQWHKQIEQEVSTNRILYNLFNRPKRFLGMMDRTLFGSAYAYKPQSTVAELLNRGSIKIANDPIFNRYHYNIDLLNTVHDSDVMQIHLSQVPNLLDILLRIKDHLTHTFIYKGRSFTIGLDAKIGFQWAGKTAEISPFTKENVENALHKIGVK